MSYNGQYMFIAVDNGFIYRSYNTGTSWMQSEATSGNWYGIACSSSGSYVFAGQSPGYMYRSTNNGVSWSVSLSISSNWYAVFVSSNGYRVYAVQNGGYIYKSVGYGAPSTWTRTSAIQGNWVSITASSDGTFCAAACSGCGIYISENYGNTWFLATDTSSNNWNVISSSSNFYDIVAGDIDYIYTNHNQLPTGQPTSAPSSYALPSYVFTQFGTQVSLLNPNMYNNAYGVARDCFNGNVFVADTNNNRILLLTNSGQVTIFQITSIPSPSTLNKPYGIAIYSTTSSNGLVYIADTNNNRILKVTESTGVVTVTYGIFNSLSPTTLSGPRALSCSSSGILFIAGKYINYIILLIYIIVYYRYW